MAKTTALEDLHSLANSVRRTYNVMRHTADQLHEETGITAPKRTLLMDLRRYGPQTVPALAASRFISRQIIQTQVNELKKEGLVSSEPNPEHKRSMLIKLTGVGDGLLDEMIARENAFIAALGWLPDPNELSRCQGILDEIYEKLVAEVDS